MPRGAALSPYWRIDRSCDRSCELTSVLGGAASMAEFVQSRLKEASARAASASAPVVLDPRLLAGFSAPIPDDVVDCIVGIAIREAGFRELSADTARCDVWPELNEVEQRELVAVHHALEDYYVSVRLKQLSPSLGYYLGARARMLVVPLLKGSREKEHRSATRDAILETWLATALYSEEPRQGTVAELLSAVRRLNEYAFHYASIADARERLSLAIETWRWLRCFPSGSGSLLEALLPDAVQRIADGRAHESVDSRMRRNVLGGAEAGSFADLSTYLVDQPTGGDSERSDEGEPLPDGAVRVTADLRELGVRAADTMVRDAEFEPDAYDRVREEVAREITAVRRLFGRLDEIESRWRYGLRRGKLDGRRLSRVASGKETVFKLRDRHHRSSMALIFLIDVSASMKSHMSTVNRAACVVAEALRGTEPAIWYEVLTYTSGGLHPGAPVQLTRLASSTRTLSLGGVWSEGGTPTGEAIAAAFLRLRGRMVRRKLVLHFTDGHPKNTYVVRQALELCRRENVDVVTVSVGTPQEALYGAGKCEVAYTVAELPEVLFRLLPRLYR
ncbi:MAG: VWA domain-containing protein [Chloroflexota bacterium]